MLFFYFCKYLVRAILKPFLDFRGILVIFWILEVFWSFFGFQEYFGYFLGFGDILVIFRFRGILVIFLGFGCCKVTNRSPNPDRNRG